MTDTSKQPSGAKTRNRKPAAFKLDDTTVHVAQETDTATDLESTGNALPPLFDQEQGGVRWGRWFAVGVGGLASLAIGLSIDALIRDLFARTDWLGWIGIGLAALAALAAIGLILREIAGLARLKRIDHIRARLSEAADTDDESTARAGLAELIALYRDRPETAAGRASLRAHLQEIIDGRDLIRLAERDILAPLDQRAVRIVNDSVKRVSVVTAVSPRAVLDLAVVLIENLRIMRRLSALYGGRPGLVGFLRLAKHVAAHLAMTGGMAAGDGIVSQVLGHGLAARLSARLGEGVINGLLTARVGIAAIAVCRPSPFVGDRGPIVTDVMGELFKGDPEAQALLNENNDKNSK